MLKRLRTLPDWVWLTFLAIVLVLRFPINFLCYPPFLMDLDVYQAVAQRVAQGLAHQLYEPTTSSVMMFKYAPCWAILWLPLAWCSKLQAAVIWSSLTVLWFLLGCAGSLRLCRAAGLRTPAWLPVAVISILVRPITAEFLNGQVDLLWGALVIGFLVAEFSRRPWWSAVCLALAIALKLPAMIFLAYLILRRRWGSAVRAAALCVAINVASAALLVGRHALDLLRAWAAVLGSSGSSRAFEIGNQNLVALLGRFLTNDGYHLNLLALSTPVIWALAAITILGLFGLVVMERPGRFVVDGSLLAILMVLGSPTVWVATYSALLFPVTLATALTLSRAARHVVDLALVAALLACSVMTHSGFWRAVRMPYFRGESYVYLVLMVLPWFGLVLFGYLWRQRALQRASAPGI